MLRGRRETIAFPPVPDPPPSRFRNGVLGSLIALGLLDQQVLNPLIAALALGLAVEVPDIGFAISAYAAAAAGAQLVVGPLSDSSGRRRWLLGAALVMLLASLAIAFGPGYRSFLLARVGAGMAGGVLSALTVAWVADVTPWSQRGRVMAVLLGGAMGTAAIGQVAGAAAAAQFGHRVVWGGIAVLAVLVLVALQRTAEPPRNRAAESLRERFAGYAGFVLDPGLRAVALSAFLGSGGIMGVMAYASGWMQESRGFALPSIGLLYGALGVMLLLTQPLAGRITDRFGKRRVTVAASLGLAGLTLALPVAGGGVLLVGMLLVFGCVSVARMAAFAALRTGMVPDSRRAAWLAFSNTSSQLGIAAGTGVGGLLYPLGFPAVCWAMAAFGGGAALLLARVPEPEA